MQACYSATGGGQRQHEGDTVLRSLSERCCPSGSWPGCLVEAATWQRVHAKWCSVGEAIRRWGRQYGA
jgi:hypothetical protein